MSEEHRFSPEDIATALKYRSEHNQACPHCKAKPLDVFMNYPAGGSHYWHLFCAECQREYTYDTYRFKLERWE